MSDEGGRKILSVNRKARFDYAVVDSLECGMSLVGTEVKSMKEIRFSYPDAYAKVENGELFLVGLHVNEYPMSGAFNHDPDRLRKLLVHKQEIKRLRRQIDEKNLTLVPLSFYLRRGIVKCELGVCKGKRERDKREDIKKRDVKREIQRELRKFS
jgi:SsrA-binding protein